MKIYLWDATEEATNAWKEISVEELKSLSDTFMVRHYVATEIKLEEVSDSGDLYFYRSYLTRNLEADNEK